MSNSKNYPLHPGQTHIEPYYTQVPTEEYEANMHELKQLRELTAVSRTTIDDIAEIKTLTSEVNALREMNAKAQEEITALKDSLRWRKCSEELPTDETEFPVILYNDWKTTDYFEIDKGRWHYHWDNVAYWFLTPNDP